MAAVLQKVCENAKQLYGMKLEAGKEGLSNIVKWVHTMESEEAAKFLHGGELVLTTGVGNAGEVGERRGGADLQDSSIDAGRVAWW